MTTAVNIHHGYRISTINIISLIRMQFRADIDTAIKSNIKMDIALSENIIFKIWINYK